MSALHRALQARHLGQGLVEIEVVEELKEQEPPVVVTPVVEELKEQEPPVVVTPVVVDPLKEKKVKSKT